VEDETMECICCGAELMGRNAFPLPLVNAMCTDCAREVQALEDAGPESTPKGVDWLDG
jgi:NMD protein affecting ribosome stability and mRNA decay